MKKGKWIIVAAGCAAAVAAAVIILLPAKKAPPGIDTSAYWLDRAEREVESISGKSAAGWRFLDIAEVRAEAGDVEGAMAMRQSVVEAEPGFLCRAADTARDILADIGIAKPRAPRQYSGVTENHFLASIAVAQARRGDIRGAEATAAKAAAGAEDDYYQVLVYTEIAKAQYRAGDLAGAKATTKLVRGGRMLAHLHAEAGDIDAARAAAEAIDGTERFWTCGEVAAIFARRGNKQGYETFIRLLEDEAEKDPKTAGDKDVVNRFLSLAYARAGDMQGAKAAIERIANPGRLHECCLAAWLCHQDGDEQAARFYFQTVLDQAQKAGKDSHVQWAIAKARAGLGDIEGAIAIAEQIPQKEVWAAEARVEIAIAMAAAGRFADLDKWISRMPAADDRARACAYAALEMIRKEAEAKKAAQNRK